MEQLVNIHIMASVVDLLSFLIDGEVFLPYLL